MRFVGLFAVTAMAALIVDLAGWQGDLAAVALWLVVAVGLMED